MKQEKSIIEILILIIKYLKVDPFVHISKQLDPIKMSVISKFYIEGYDREDCMQEANKALYEAIQKYNPSSPMNFPQYYKMYLTNRFIQLLRNSQALKRKGMADAMRIENADEILKEKISSFSASSPEEQSILHESFDTYLSELSSFEKEVFHLSLIETSYEEIALQLNCSKDKVENALYRCKVKLKDLLGEK